MSTILSGADWKARLTDQLEPLLKSPTLLADASAYQGVPFVLFHYPPTAELELRREVQALAKRVEGKTRRKILILSMADLLWEAIQKAHPPDARALFDAERTAAADSQTSRLEMVTEHVRAILSEEHPLPDRISQRARDLSPEKDILFLVRVGALFPVYRASALLENLMGTVRVPTVLFYPGARSGTNSLRFMDSLDALHSYRHKIF
jgi:hypothetical protein